VPALRGAVPGRASPGPPPRSEHYDRLDDAEREAFDEAYLAENADLRSFRLRALAVLVLLYFGFLILYAVVTL